MRAWRDRVLILVLTGFTFTGCRRPDSQLNPPPTEYDSDSPLDSQSGQATRSDSPAPVNPVSSTDTNSGSISNEGIDTTVGDSDARGRNAAESEKAIASGGAGGATGGANPPLAPGPEFRTPDSAHRFASARRGDARQKAESGNEAEAFELALKGWNALQPHLADSDCHELSAELLTEIERYGEKLGSQGHRVIGKPLKIK